jgi:hypothetical protein
MGKNEYNGTNCFHSVEYSAAHFYHLPGFTDLFGKHYHYEAILRTKSQVQEIFHFFVFHFFDIDTYFNTGSRMCPGNDRNYGSSGIFPVVQLF